MCENLRRHPSQLCDKHTRAHAHARTHARIHTLSFYSSCRVVTFRGQMEETGNTYKILVGNRLKMAT